MYELSKVNIETNLETDSKSNIELKSEESIKLKSDERSEIKIETKPEEKKETEEKKEPEKKEEEECNILEPIKNVVIAFTILYGLYYDKFYRVIILFSTVGAIIYFSLALFGIVEGIRKCKNNKKDMILNILASLFLCVKGAVCIGVDWLILKVVKIIGV